MRRQRLAAKAEAWKAERLGRKWNKVKPLVIGPIWSNAPNNNPALVEQLNKYKVGTFFCESKHVVVISTTVVTENFIQK